MCGSVKKRTDVEIPLLPNNFFGNYLSLDPGILVVCYGEELNTATFNK